MDTITQFSDEYRFLSNFWLVTIVDPDDNTVSYPSVEHYYQAQKTLDMNERLLFTDTNLTAGKAKKLGKNITQRQDWDEVRYSAMEYGLRQKFAKRNSQLRIWLLMTGDKYIQEGNFWGDKKWGFCLKTNEGENQLGKLLMQIREDINNRLH